MNVVNERMKKRMKKGETLTKTKRESDLETAKKNAMKKKMYIKTSRTRNKRDLLMEKKRIRNEAHEKEFNLKI